jgi:hypothetical protein
MRGLIGVAALTVAMAVTLTTGVASANGGGDRTRKVSVWTETVQDNFLDLGDPGVTLGDRFIFSDDVSRTRGGDVIGSTGGECTVVRVDEEFYDSTVQCLVTVWLRGGQITVQGLLSESDERATLAVTGGTGRYKGASGQVKVRFFSDTEAKLVFQLKRR